MNISQIIRAAKKYMPNLDERKILDAYSFANEAHKGQKRYDGSPYITHPLETCMILTGLQADEDMLITALLHDVPEDTSFSLKDVEKKFGKEVSFLVEGVTKLSRVYYKHNMADRQIESLKRLFLHSAKDLRIILVKLADRLHNMRTLENMVNESKRLLIANETLEIYVPVANLLGIWEIKFEMEDLCFKHIYPTDYAKMNSLVEQSAIRNDSILKETLKIARSAMKSKGINAEIYARKKNIYSIFKKMVRTGRQFKDIYDLIALRVIVNKVDECYLALGAIHQTFKPKPKRVKDYIAVPKVNGYKSIHTTVFGIDGVITEFQIRTKQMHVDDEYGIAAHYFYDYSKAKKQKIGEVFKKHADWATKILNIQKEARTSSDFVDGIKFDIFQDRIFVFTPRGDVIDLPYGSNVVDFAYHIHSDIGDHILSAEINGEPVLETAQLKTGDTVKIETSKDVHGPKREWLQFVKTSLAKTRIKEFFRKESTQKNYNAGLTILEKELKLLGLNELKKMSQSEENLFLKNFSVKSKRELITLVGSGDISVKTVIRTIYSHEELLGIPPDNKDKSLYQVELNIIFKDRVGFLRDVAMLFSNLGVNITQIRDLNADSNMRKHLIMTIEVKDLEHLDGALTALSSVKDVVKVWKR